MTKHHQKRIAWSPIELGGKFQWCEGCHSSARAGQYGTVIAKYINTYITTAVLSRGSSITCRSSRTGTFRHSSASVVRIAATPCMVLAYFVTD